MRGKFKKDFALNKKDKLYHTDITVVGDHVQFDLLNDSSGVIHTIEKRKNYLSRKAPRIKGASYRGERLEQIIAANIDYFFIISSIFEPLFNNKTIDRLLVIGESANVTPILVINKADLDPGNLIDEWIDLYRGIGYKVIKASAKTGLGLDEIMKLIPHKKNLFWGQSGVGKSSILNSLFPGLKLQKIGKISSYTERGIHTTVTSIMVKTDNDTFIIDTPGIREIDPFGIRKEDLGHYFIEFARYMPECKFNTCTHDHEPGCTVEKAAHEGNISPERYDSYLRILNTIEEDIFF